MVPTDPSRPDEPAGALGSTEPVSSVPDRGVAGPPPVGRVDAARRRGTTWWTEFRARSQAAELATSLYERDRSAHASVLGSAVALRLFLFLVPATVALVGLVGVLHVRSFLEEHLEATVATGEVARNLSDVSGWRSLSLILTGTILTLWAGRSLTYVLSTCAVSAWRMDPARAKSPPLTVLALTGILLGSIAASAVVSLLREVGGVPVAFAVWVGLVAITTTAWFLVMVTLPRGVSDPGALLPGALAMGLGFTALQAVMHVYLPGRVDRTSDTFGSLAATVAVLGNFFFIGRIMAASFVINAVTYERFGSLSQLVFGLPVLQRLPRRYPSLARYFSLDDVAPTGAAADSTPADPNGADCTDTDSTADDAPPVGG